MVLREIRRGLKRTSFLVILTIVSIFCIYSAFQIPAVTREEVLSWYMKGYVLSAYDGFVMFYPAGDKMMIAVILPLLSAICYSDTYLEDKKSGFLKNIYTRCEKKKYLVAKYIANFIVSGIAIAVPLLINIIILLLRCPSVQTDPILGFETIVPTILFSHFYYTHPLIYILMWIVICFLVSGIFASIGLSLGIFIKKRIAVVVLPFVLSIVFGCISDIVLILNCNFLNCIEGMSLINFIILCGKDPVIMLITCTVLVISTFMIFFIGGKKSEIF